MRRLTLLLVFAMSLFVLGCESSLTLSFRTQSPVNALDPEDASTSRAVDLRIYQLQDTEQQLSGKFNENNIGSIIDNAEEYLKAEFLSKMVPEPMNPPKKDQTYAESEIIIKKLNAKTTHIGVVAMYDQSDAQPRVQLLTVEEASGKIFLLTGYHIEFVQGSN
ncbi:MAG: type VI secretion system lipoprotein TssJ [Planctomycetota bacterium]